MANRVASVQELVPQECWHYVPTHENPADLATRSMSVGEFKNSELWWHGLSWLEFSLEASLDPPARIFCGTNWIFRRSIGVRHSQYDRDE